MPTVRDRLEEALVEAMRLLNGRSPHDWNRAYDPPSHRQDCRYCAWLEECKAILPERLLSPADNPSHD